MSSAVSGNRPGLLGPNDVRELAGLMGVTPTKKLGQNFVHDPNTVRKIVRLAGVNAGDRVLEIGPGLGSLTLGIIEARAHVTAVEIDDRLAALLPETISKRLGLDTFQIINKDALLLDPDDFEGQKPEVLVANLPYNVSVPILMHLLELLPSLERGLVMVQAEVGQRIASPKNSKTYGAPSAKAAWYGNWRVASNVSRNIFWPVPGVDSVLVSFERHKDALGSESERQKTFEIINSAFLGRRKMLRQSLQQILGVSSSEAAETLLEKAGVPGTARAENLAVEDYLKIARTVV